jgi:hypothetical protein
VKLKLDENLAFQSAVTLLRGAGHDVATVPEQQLAGAADTRVIAACAQEQRCLVTLDMDFANPLVFRPSLYAGIAVLRHPRRPSLPILLELLRGLAEGLAHNTIGGQLWIVQVDRIRIYQQPQ